MNRREMLHGLGAMALGAAATRLPLAFPRRAGFAEPDVDITLTAAPGRAQILPGAPTDVWRFTGTLHKGPPGTLQPIAGSYLGPTIRLKKGQRVRVRFRNDLPEESIVHWHGLDVPEAADGHPRLAIGPGAEYVYEFEVLNRAGTYWYHPHPHHKTGSQVYRGLAGLLVVTDDEEASLGLPAGDAELAWVLQDRDFDAGNQLRYLGGGMMDQMHGLLAGRMLVNGAVAPRLELATRAYRIRLLNGSSSRVYKLAWDDGTPMTVIGVDGGLLDAPVEQQYLTLAPAQRADVILDLSRREVGAGVQLLSAPFLASEIDAAQGGMMGRGAGAGAGAGSGAANGAPLSLVTVRVARRGSSSFALPAKLSSYGPAWDAVTDAPVRRVTLDFRGGQWLLAGRTFDMLGVAPDETVRADSVHVWEVANVGGMMGRQMAHPFHVHGTQFRVLGRANAGASPPAGSVREGLVDTGWRDTVLVLPGDTVRLQMRFTRYPGLYLYHCHILEHEDMGMMRNFRVSA